MRERGLKLIIYVLTFRLFLKSLPMRERGLKPVSNYVQGNSYESLPMRERGLKQCCTAILSHRCPVAPHAGAWVET